MEQQSEQEKPEEEGGDLPDVHFGQIGSKLINWRETEPDNDPYDEALVETPPDVVEMLGFDPLEDDGEDATR